MREWRAAGGGRHAGLLSHCFYNKSTGRLIDNIVFCAQCLMNLCFLYCFLKSYAKVSQDLDFNCTFYYVCFLREIVSEL